MFEVRDATQCSFDDLRSAMENAFSDYAIPLRLGANAFDHMMRQRGLDRSKSRIAVMDGQVVAIWLVSVRARKAYLISSGTHPEYRARGLSRALAEECLAGLRKEAVCSFQTEVLQNNEIAAGLYYSLGMTQNRALACYAIPVPAASVEAALVGAAPVEAVARDMSARFSAVAWGDISPVVGGLRDWVPSWQNADASLDRISTDVTCLACSDISGLAAYAAVNRDTGTLYQMAVRQDLRRCGIGTELIYAVHRMLPDTPLRVINVQQADAGFRSLMARVGAQETIGQYELTMAL